MALGVNVKRAVHHYLSHVKKGKKSTGHSGSGSAHVNLRFLRQDRTCFDVLYRQHELVDKILQHL